MSQPLACLARGVAPPFWILLAAGCAGAASSGQEPAPAPTTSPPAVDRAAEPADWAAAAVAGCGPLAFDARPACYDEWLMAVLEAAGVGAAMETLERIGAVDAETYHHGHVLAHHIGIAAYRSPDDLGTVFADCRPSFQSGCYHGVIQAYFAELGVAAAGRRLDAQQIDGVCADHRGRTGDRWLLFQCVHGIGHGLVALHDHHLPRALEGCDLLSEAWEREGCYGGAFMENVVAATMPHHAPAAGRDGGDSTAHGGHHDHEDHGHDHPGDHAHAARPPAGHAHPVHGVGGPDSGFFMPLDPDDPHYPCSVLNERYLHACYSMQSSAVLFWSGGEVAAGIELCEGAPERARATCYTSLGRDINAYSQHRSGPAIAQCMRVTERFQPSCLIGVAKNLIDVTAAPRDGLAFCASLPPGRNRERCFQAVGEQIAVLEASPERRAAICRPLEATDARACRFGAGVPDELAAQLPEAR